MPFVADLNYPPQLAELVKVANAAFETWAEADTAYAEALDNLEQAEVKFAASIKAAALKGEPLPDPLDTAPLQNAITYAAEVMKAKKRATDEAIRDLKNAFREHRLEIARLAIDKAEAGLEEYKSRMAEVSQELDELERNRRAAYDGLKMFAEYSTPEMAYSPDFTNHSTATLPNTSEQRVKSLLHNLKAVFFPATPDKGHSDEAELETAQAETAEETKTPRPAAKRAKTL